MVDPRPRTWYWRSIWLAGIALLLVLAFLYLFLPLDGASGSLDAFSAEGFTPDRLLQASRTEWMPGDRIQAINNQPLETWLMPGTARPAAPNREPATYTLVRENQIQQVEVPLTRLNLSDNTTVLWVGTAAGLLLMVSGGFLLSQTHIQQVNRILIICCTAAAVYIFTSAFGFQAGMLRYGWYFWLQLAINQLSYAWLFASTLHLVLEFFPTPIRLYGRFLRPILILIYAFTPLVMLVSLAAAPTWMQKLSWLNIGGLLAVCLQFILALFVILSRILTDHHPMAYVIRKWLLFGFLLSISLAILSQRQAGTYSLPFQAGHSLGGDNPSLLTTETGWLFLVLLPFYLTASIPRRHFLKIDRLLVRAFTYLMALILYGVLYTGLIYLLSILSGWWSSGLNPFWMHLAAMFLIFILFAMSLPRLRSGMEKLLCPNRLHYQTVLPELRSQLQTKLEMEQLHQLMCHDIPARLECQGASLLVLDSTANAYVFSGNLHDDNLAVDHPLAQYLESNHKAILRFYEECDLPADIRPIFQEHQVELCIPLIHQKKLVGIYNFGSKNSGVPYTLEEIALISSLGKPGAIAVENAFSWRRAAAQAEEMAEEVRQRTVELERVVNESQEDRQAALQADKVKRVFLQSVSREIRMPMNAILGMAGLLLTTSLDEHQRGLVDSIRSNSDDLLEIINNILEYAFIESGKLALEPQPFKLTEFIESVLDLIGPEASRKGIDLSYTIDAQTPVMITADLARMTQILYHLLDNAVRFTEAGAISLNVQANPYQNGAQYDFLQTDTPMYELVFSVKDTGAGISRAQFDQIFDSYHQSADRPEELQNGIGLGLTISKRLCELMGGKIWLESAGIPGKGSTFHFTVLVNSTSDTYPAYLDVNQPQLKGKRLLIVEEETAERRILMLQIRSWGMDVIAVNTIEEALDRLKSETAFDLVLLSTNSNTKDITSFFEKIDPVKTSRNLPFVFAVPRYQMIQEPLFNRFSAVLTKPIKADQLYNVLIQVFTSEVNTRSYHPPAQISELLPQEQPVDQLAMQILLVEDNPTSQKISTLLLENLGYRVDRASNGNEALESIQRQQYDVIFMDVHMPEMDGLQATSLIRRRFQAERQPFIVALAVLDTPEERETCRKAGMDEFLVKPLKIGDLVWAIKQARTQQPSDAGREQNGYLETKSSQPPSPPSLDLEVIRRLRKSAGERGDQLVREITTAYLADVEILLKEMHQALETNQAEDLRRAAHTLRSNSTAVGAAAIAQIALKLEKDAAENGIPPEKASLAERLEQVELERDRLVSTLRAIDQARKPPAG